MRSYNNSFLIGIFFFFKFKINKKIFVKKKKKNSKVME